MQKLHAMQKRHLLLSNTVSDRCLLSHKNKSRRSCKKKYQMDDIHRYWLAVIALILFLRRRRYTRRPRPPLRPKGTGICRCYDD